MVAAVSKEVERVVDTHKTRDAKWYNEVGSLSGQNFLEHNLRNWQTGQTSSGSHKAASRLNTARSRREPCILSPDL